MSEDKEELMTQQHLEEIDSLTSFCTELLENAQDIEAALRMIGERICEFYHLDDLVCVEHNAGGKRILCQRDSEKEAPSMREIQKIAGCEWDHLCHLTDPEGCIVYSFRGQQDTREYNSESETGSSIGSETGSAMVILSTSVRDYRGSIVFADGRQDRNWARMKNNLLRIANQIFYRLRERRQQENRQRAMNLKLNYDRLTGLPVYTRFIISAQEYLEHYGNAQLCCVYTDFSGFQHFNQTYGYETGDGILRKLADALTGRYGGCGLFARVSSDNFVGIVRGMTAEELYADYRDFTVSFAEECNKEYPLTNLVLTSGVYEVQSTDRSVGSMVDNANAARKKCKEQKVETMVRVYTESLRQEQEKIRSINANILKGLKNGEFHAYLQPKVSLKTGRIEGAEALVRWIKPDGTRVMPEEFISIAERTGYVTRIDFEVLEQVLAYLREAVNEGEEVVPVSVNFSRKDNEHEDFVPNILKRLEHYHIPSSLLEAEVTESVFMADLSMVERNMKLLRGEGVEVSVDDFGSGYSSLNMLAKVSADTIKLDRLFLNNANKDERGLTVIQYLTKMLKKLGFTVLAEGVETEEQLNWMRMADCDLVQGFYYAKPMSIPDFRIFLRQFNSMACGVV